MRTDLRSSCFKMVYRNLEMAPSVGMVRFRRRLAMVDDDAEASLGWLSLSVKKW